LEGICKKPHDVTLAMPNFGFDTPSATQPRSFDEIDKENVKLKGDYYAFPRLKKSSQETQIE